MTSQEIRQTFLDFFRSKGHTIVDSASLLPEAPNLLFTNAGMNQFVPIFLGRERCPYVPPRAVDTQKCIRAGGKHNDLEDVGLDTYHHTFFEMLGNWSFGDYFKAEAIKWAWELLTEHWHFPKERLYATVYKPDAAAGDPAEMDREAYEEWARIFSEAGMDPGTHIVFGGKKDNFWMMGETGPCGPCSEIHIDLTPNGDTRGALVNQDSGECIEIWNLVFIQFNATPVGGFEPLAAKHVDTGMGFERVAAIRQCTRGFTDFNRIVSNYDTDIFRPFFDVLERISGRNYGGTLPKEGVARSEREKTDVAFRVIADHIRTLGLAIADGILPGNTDRNYVLRRILRRAVRYGRSLDLHEPFFFQLVDVLAETMGGVFPEIEEKRDFVRATIRSEEEAFNKTLDRGIELFREHADGLKPGAHVSGEFAFKLYDTYGFPLDLTQLMARERGLTVDTEAFESLMEEQRARARAAQKKEVVSMAGIDTEVATSFVGYDSLEAEAEVAEVVRIRDKTAVITTASPFYAEMGGQVGDTGSISGHGHLWRVQNTLKADSAYLHFVEESEPPAAGTPVMLQVDRRRREAIQRHHTVTHLFHWALHEVVNREASQKGSYVGPDKLTFDFNCQALTDRQVMDIEKLVNERILENTPVSAVVLPYDEVRRRDDIMQFFGEKYGDQVRVVQIGGKAGRLDGYSMELCGGTHTQATAEVGIFRIVAESAIAAGVRRVEALAGLPAYARAARDAATLERIAAQINTPVNELEKKIEGLLHQHKRLEKELKAMRQKQAAASAGDLIQRAETIGDFPVILGHFRDADGAQLQAIAEGLKGRFDGIAVLAASAGGSVNLAICVAPTYAKSHPAGKLMQQLAPVVGGKGGGKPELARGGGNNPAKIQDMLEEARRLLANSKV